MTTPRRALLIANAPVATLPPGFRPAPADLIIAADGGTAHALAWGWPLAAVVGDMDSLPDGARERLAGQNVRWLTTPPRKDETDLELAIHLALEEGATEILIFGAVGGRIDQTIANMLLLEIPAEHGVPAVIVDGTQWLRLICSGETATIHGRPGDTLSLIPLGGDAVGITTAHLEYPLRDETLYFGPTRGVSNVLTAAVAKVTLRAGRLLAIHIQQG